MGQVAESFEAVVGAWPQPWRDPTPPSSGATPATARLIPGSQAKIGRPAALRSADTPGYAKPADAKVSRMLKRNLLPAFFAQVSPAMLGVLATDVLFLVLLLTMVQWLLGISADALTAYFALFLGALMQEGVYKGRPSPDTVRLRLARAGIWSGLISALALACSASPAQYRAELLLLTIANMILLCGWRWAWGQRATTGRTRTRNVLVVGSSSRAEIIARGIQRSGSDRCVRTALPEWQLRGQFQSLSQTARELHIDQVILATDDLDLTNRLVSECIQNSLDVAIAPKLPGEVAGLERLGDEVLVQIHQEQIAEWQLAAKRLIDIVISTILGIALLPLLCAIALLIKLDSRGPVFYPAVRIGRKGQRFTCYKFRTMVPHAAALKDELRRANERHGAFFKISNDPRITRLGRILRRYSLDELPQLWNVLRGEMSLVGPRPHPVDDAERYELEDLQRLDVTPGITGLWQVTAREDPSFRRCIELDAEYIKRWSLRLDLQILCRTAGAVLRGSGV